MRATNIGFFKRLLLMVYDGLLLFGVVIVGYGLLFVIISLLPNSFDSSLLGRAVKVIYLVLATFGFYAWFWTHGGQTLGMKVWNIFLVDQQGKFISWQRSALRYLAALLSWGLVPAILYLLEFERWYLAIGLGFSWALISRKNLTWHDMLTRTHLFQVSKQPSSRRRSPPKQSA